LHKTNLRAIFQSEHLVRESMASVSGLDLVPGGDALMLHQPHQARQYDAPGDKYMRALNVNNPAFGKNNTVQLEALEMVPDELFVELTLMQLDIGDANPDLVSYVPTPAMISDNGIQLFYNGQSVYTISEAEALMYNFVNSENIMQQMRRFDAQNLYPRRTISGATGQPELKNAAAAMQTYYLDLRPFLKIMKHAGPLGAYSPNKWSMSIGLLAPNLVGQAASTDATVVANAEVFSMRLLISGHREDPQNTMRISQALAADGIKIAFTQSNAFSFSLGAATGTTTFSITSLEGEATDIWLLNRVTGGLTAINTAGQTVDKTKFEVLRNPNQQIAIGTQSNPTRIYGQYMPYETLRLIAQGGSYSGGPMWLSNNATTAAGAATQQVLNDVSALFLPLAEAATDGQLYGSYSGSIRLKNDFVVNYQMGTAPAAANTVNVIVYIRRIMIITHLGIVMMNEG